MVNTHTRTFTRPPDGVEAGNTALRTSTVRSIVTRGYRVLDARGNSVIRHADVVRVSRG